MVAVLAIAAAATGPARAQSYTITLPSVSNGSVSAKVNDASVTSAAAGATVSLVATPDAGYRLKTISGTYPQETLSKGAATRTGDYFTLTASYSNNAGWSLYSSYTITISSTYGGNISSVVLNISPKASFAFGEMSVDHGSMTRDGNVITISGINSSSVVITGTNRGSAYGCTVNSATITGTTALSLTSTGDDNVKTFTMPSSNVTVSAEFEELPLYTVTFAEGTEDVGNWSITPAEATTTGVAQGSELTATYNGTQKVKSVKAVKYVPPVLVESIVLDKQTAFLAKDSTMTLSVASVLPENAADKSYTWSSDATGVALVNQNGVVTGVAAGTANIIATANDGSGVADTCVVTVLSSAILDGVRVLYATHDNEPWSTVIGYNPGVLYQDDDDNVRLTSNGAFLYHDGLMVYVLENFYTGSNGYQWMRVVEIDGSKFYYRQGETWHQAIDAGRMYNEMWSIEGGHVKNLMQTLVDSNYQPIAPTATIDPSTVNYYLWTLDN